MLNAFGEICLIRKLRKAISQFDKRGTLPNAEIITDDLCKFSLNDGALTLNFCIAKMNSIHYVFSLSVTKTVPEGISIIHVDSTPIHSFSMYGALESSLTYVSDRAETIIALK